MTSQSFELPHRPSDGRTVDVAAHAVEGRWVESTVVVDPTGDHRVEHPCEILGRFVALQLQRPSAALLPSRLGRSVADREREFGEDATIPIVDSPRSKPVTQDVELDMFVHLLSMKVFAVDDPCLVGDELRSRISSAAARAVLSHTALTSDCGSESVRHRHTGRRAKLCTQRTGPEPTARQNHRPRLHLCALTLRFMRRCSRSRATGCYTQLAKTRSFNCQVLFHVCIVWRVHILTKWSAWRKSIRFVETNCACEFFGCLQLHRLQISLYGTLKQKFKYPLSYSMPPELFVYEHSRYFTVAFHELNGANSTQDLVVECAYHQVICFCKLLRCS